jgi:hypothetical protein
MTTEYRWNGDLIVDVEKWARDRGESMVEFEERERNPFTGAWDTCDRGAMPESFWNARREGPDRMMVYKHHRAPRG